MSQNFHKKIKNIEYLLIIMSKCSTVHHKKYNIRIQKTFFLNALR